MFFGGSNNRNSNNHPKLKITYFDARGRGELSRFILAYAGRDFEDNVKKKTRKICICLLKTILVVI